MSSTMLNPTQRSVGVHSDLGWNRLYGAGGVCLILVGAIYLFGAALSIILKAPAPSDSQAYVQALAVHPRLMQLMFGLYALSDLLLLPAVLALYLVLRHKAPGAMLVGAGLLLLFIAVDLTLTESSSLALVNITRHYAAANSDAQRSIYAAAQAYALAGLPLATFYSFVVSSVGLLIVSIFMFNGIFSKPTAYAGIVASVEGIIGGFYILLPVLAVLLNPCLIAFGIWSVLAGQGLYKLSQPAT